MRTGLTLTGIVAVGLLAAGVMAATPAHADSGSIPSDCSVTNVSEFGLSLTCTQRPATQVWTVGATCYTMVGPVGPLPGSQVTGDGTSTIDCRLLNPTATFIIDS
jgi:hypothetical protein